MNFNTIKDIASLRNTDFATIVSDRHLFNFIYANRVSFYEWLQIYFSDKHLANHLNALVNYRHHISRTFIDLSNQSIRGENELSLLKQIVSHFPRISVAKVDLDNFLSNTTDIMATIRHLKNLRKLTIITSAEFEFDNREYYFDRISELEFEYRFPNNYSTHSLGDFMLKMPQLQKIYLTCVCLTNSFYQQINALKLEEIYLYDVECIDLESIQLLPAILSLTKLSIRFYSLSNLKATALCKAILSCFISKTCSIEDLTFEVTSSDSPLHFEAISYLSKLKKLTIFACIRDMNTYFNVTRILFLIPQIKHYIQIDFHLIRPNNRFDLTDISHNTSIRRFIVSIVSDFAVTLPNFSFSL